MSFNGAWKTYYFCVIRFTINPKERHILKHFKRTKNYQIIIIFLLWVWNMSIQRRFPQKKGWKHFLGYPEHVFSPSFETIVVSARLWELLDIFFTTPGEFFKAQINDFNSNWPKTAISWQHSPINLIGSVSERNACAWVLRSMAKKVILAAKERWLSSLVRSYAYPLSNIHW